MKTIINLIQSDKIKFASFAIVIGFFALFVILPLLPNVQSEYSEVSLRANVANAETNSNGEQIKSDAPGCTVSTQSGDIKAYFSGKEIIFSTNNGKNSKGESLKNPSTSISKSIPAGNYKVFLEAYDGYSSRTKVWQPKEYYKVQFKNGGTVVATTNRTSDLKDYVSKATWKGVVNENLKIKSSVNTVTAVHAAYVDNSSPNSLVPICVVLRPYVPPTPKPTCTLDANPNLIDEGDNSTLTWTTKDASSISINNGVGSVGKNGNTSVNPLGNTTYTLTATGSGGTANCETSIAVIQPAPKPACTLGANPSTINRGDNSTLTWTTKNASSISINNGVGSVGKNGNTSVNPLGNTTYTLTATGSGGTANCIDTITVIDNRECKLEISKSVDKTSSNIGDTLEYTINFKNIGDGDCTGDGVRVVDVVDDNVKYLSELHSWNVSDGYWSGSSAYNDGTINWNAYTLIPGESGWVKWKGEVKKQNVCGDFSVYNTAKISTKEFSNFSLWVSSNRVVTNVANQCIPAPTCTLDANPNAITKGDSSTLKWTTTNVASLTIDNGVVSTKLDDSELISPTSTTKYTLTALGTDGSTKACYDTIVVIEPKTPAIEIIKRDAGDGNDTQTITKGETATFEIVVKNIGETTLKDIVVTDPLTNSCAKTIGTLAIGASDTYTCTDTNVQSNYTNIAYVTGKSTKDNTVVKADDPSVVIVNIPKVLSCDSFTSSRNPVTSGSTFSLIWNTTGATNTSINQGIGNVANDGSINTSIKSDTRFTLNISNSDDSITCSTDVVITSGGGGGGGGGSRRPRCEFEASDTKIKAGDDVVLTWKNRSTNDITIEDNRGNVLIDTDRSKDKDVDEDKGSITVNPTKDTTYTLTAKRGSRERTCEVDIEMESGGVSVTSIRTQSPLVAGISLSRVPYTGFDAGPMLTAIFYILLVAWSVGIGYVLVIRREPVLGFKLSEASVMRNNNLVAPEITNNVTKNYVEDVESPVPSDLPTTESFMPVMPAQVGYGAVAKQDVFDESEDSEQDEMVALENHAHTSNTLLSSDAMRYILNHTADYSERLTVLDGVIKKALAMYPREDGWMVINRERVTALLDDTPIESEEVTEEDTTIPVTEHVGSSSLAESIIAGNIVAAYQLLGDNPIFALADAAQDLDALYRNRKGEDVAVSDMLLGMSKDISDASILTAIEALTSAIDGVYDDETSAVKLAVMKSVRALT